MITGQAGGHQPRLLASTGADRVAPPGVPDSSLMARPNRDRRRRRAGRALLAARSTSAGPRRAGADLGGVGHHRPDGGRAVQLQPATSWSTARPSPRSTPPKSDPERAHAVNAVGPGTSRRPVRRQARGLIHISTDYVFSGSFDGEPRPYEIDDETGPLQRLRHAPSWRASSRCCAAMPDAHVVRTAWIYDGGDGSTSSRRSCAGWRRATSPSTWWPTRSARRPTSVIWSPACCEIADGADPRAGAARRQRGRGQPVRAGPGGVRGRRRRPGPRPPRRHRPRIRAPRRGPPYSALSGTAVRRRRA